MRNVIKQEGSLPEENPWENPWESHWETPWEHSKENP